MGIRSNAVVSTTVDATASQIKFDVVGAGSVVLRLGMLSDTIRQAAVLHGMKQRVSDAAAISRDPLTGKSASPSDKLAAMRELVEHYETGTTDWKRAGGGPGLSADAMMLINCLRELYPSKSDGDIAALVGAMTAIQRKAMLIDERVAPIVLRINSERAKGVNVDELFAGLDY
jgi:hypothetical protein